MIREILHKYIDDLIIKHKLNVKKQGYDDYYYYFYSGIAILSIDGGYLRDLNSLRALELNNPNLLEEIEKCLLSWKNWSNSPGLTI